MSESSPSTQRQLNYIRVLVKENMTPDTMDLDTYFSLRKLTPEDLSNGEASDLIECLEDGRAKIAMDILKQTIKNKK